jgi:hypothetical protein
MHKNMSNLFLKKKAEAEGKRRGIDHNKIDHNKLSIFSNKYKYKNVSKDLYKIGYNKSFLPANKE